MKNIQTYLVFLFLGISMLLPLNSCKKNKNCKESNNSEAGSDDSHNFGQNCMTCHYSEGKGEGCFNAAGSVYNANFTVPLVSGTVKFYTGPNGTGALKYTIPIDAKGNFHRTDEFDYSGLYPAIVTSNGTKYMSSSLTSGACNSCHGNSTSSLYGL